MKASDFTRSEQVRGLISGLQEDCKDKSFSDVVDDEGNEYVDLVMEGGAFSG